MRTSLLGSVVNKRKEKKIYEKYKPDLVRDVPEDALGSPETPEEFEEKRSTAAINNKITQPVNKEETVENKQFYCLSLFKEIAYAIFQPTISRLRGGYKESLDNNWELNIDEINEFQWIGSGAQGVVFLGKWRNQDVAIKKVRTQRDTDIKHLRDLDHRNIIKFR